MTRLSLLAPLLLVTLSTIQPSSALSYTGPQLPRRAQHATPQQLAHAHSKKRMIKVRQNNVLPGNNGINIGNDNGHTSASAAATESQSSAAPTTTTPVSTSTPASQSSASGGLLASVLSGALSSDSAAPTSTVIVTETASSTSLSASSPTSTLAASSTPAQSLSLDLQGQSTPSNSATLLPGSTVIKQTVDLPTNTASAAAASDSAKSFGIKSIIAIVVIASVVGGIAAIWTLIRKWKLGTSAKFENRMQPIQWNPEMGGDAELPGAMREKGYGTSAADRRTSTGSHGSFHSSDSNPQNIGRNVTGNANMFAPDHDTSGFAPEAHDFTAGAAIPAHGYEYPANYVDLQRANSGSQAVGADLTRGPTLGRTGYAEDYQAYPPNGAYPAHDGYAQDAYGAYDMYGQHQYAAGPADPYARVQYPATGPSAPRY